MKRCKTSSFIQEFELLEPATGGFRGIDLVQEFGRKLYNAVLGKLKKKVNRVKSSAEWSEARKLPRSSASRAEAFKSILVREGLTETQVDPLVRELRVGDFEDFLGSHVAQRVGSRAWQAIEKLIYGKAKRVRFKRGNEFFSVEAKDNKSFLRLIVPGGLGGLEDGPPYILLSKNKYFLSIDPQCPYQKHALGSRCKYVRLVKKKIHGRIRYFAQLICEGSPYNDLGKLYRHTEDMKAFLGEGALNKADWIDPKYQSSVCIDFGPKNIAVSTATHSFERSIAEGLVDRSKEIKRLQRKMARSLKANNLENLNPNGTITKGKKVWNKSNVYIRLQNEKADLQRKQAAHRRSIQGCLANDILALGNIIKLEKVSYKGFQKIYGKSVGLHAPSSLKDMLTRKAENARGKVELINTFETRLSQTCLCGEQLKKPLHVRVHRCERCQFGNQTTKVGRDTLSAFLGVFTDNREDRVGRKIKYSSSLNLQQANLAIRGHRTLTLAGLEALKINPNIRSYAFDGAERSAVEGSARTA